MTENCQTIKGEEYAMKTVCTSCKRLVDVSPIPCGGGKIAVCPLCGKLVMNISLENAAALMGRKGGSVKSERKARASRENGKLGGRPRKERSNAGNL
jgi:hypothetical protein